MKTTNHIVSIDGVLDKLTNNLNELIHEVTYKNEDLHLLPGDVKLMREKLFTEAKAQLEQLILEIIDTSKEIYMTNDLPGMLYADDYIKIREELRQEQKARLQALLKGGSDDSSI